MEKITTDRYIIGQSYYSITTPLNTQARAMASHARTWMTSVLIASDLFSLLISILLAQQVRSLGSSTLDPYYHGVFTVLAIILIWAFARRGVYPGIGLNYVDELREVVSSTSFTFLLVIGITFLLKTTSVYSRLMLLVIWTLSMILIPTNRYAIRHLLTRLRLWGEPVAIIGDMSIDGDLVRFFINNPHLGLRPIAILHDEYFLDGIPTHGPSMSITQISESARRLSLKTALVVINDLNSLDVLVNRYRFVFQHVILVKSRNGSYALNNMKSLDLSGILGLQVRNNLLNFWSQVFKRILDLCISTLGLLFLSPFLGLIAVLVRLDSPGPVFYFQKRLGRGGNVVKVIKFRTMHRDAEQILNENLIQDSKLRQEWESYQKLRKDPRITAVGRFLRRFSLDELPQLWNVMRGEMSLVGPRPILPNQRDRYGESFKEYIQVAPGITGLWQVSGRNDTTFVRRAELDIEYIQRWSVWLDIYILLKTIKIVLWRSGAY